VKFDDGPPCRPDTGLVWLAKPKKCSSASGIPPTPSKNEIPQSQRVDSESDAIKKLNHPELYDVLRDSNEQDSSTIDGDILAWVESAYKSSRGLELGTFDPAILPLLFKEQTIHWEHLAMTYISSVILHVRRFCDQL
jgi:hypothetical protein